ncbi:MAG: hypothetical protein II779_15915, partial [Clostridia bacterium]|nr:hypothetical protein [Clostridia bacterium]
MLFSADGSVDAVTKPVDAVTKPVDAVTVSVMADFERRGLSAFGRKNVSLSCFGRETGCAGGILSTSVRGGGGCN